MKSVLQKSLFIISFLLTNKICFAQFNYFTHNTGTLQFDAFNNGTIGSNAGFGGVYFQGGNNLNAMFKGGIMIGTSSTGVNGIINWFDDMSSTSSILNYTTNPNFNQVANANFNDTFAPAPFGFDFYQQTFSNTGDDFVVYSYTISNNSGSDANGIYVGIFADWDVGAGIGFAVNRGGYDQSKNLAYQYQFGGANDPNYYGVVALDGMAGARVTTEYNVASIRIDAFNWMSTFLNESITTNGDYRSYIGSGPYSIPDGSSINVGFAIVAGSNLTDLQSNADIAQNKWGSGIVTMPFVAHNGPQFYEGTIGPFPVEAIIFDYSTISSAEVHYSVDGGISSSIDASTVVGNQYTFNIPAQVPGAVVEYWFEITATSGNILNSGTSRYISGNFLGDPFVSSGFAHAYYGINTSGIAVKHNISEGYNSDLVSAVMVAHYRFDSNIDSIKFHIWDDNNGFPGNDLITPFKVRLADYPERIIVDLRSYSELSSLTGTFHIGFSLEPGDTLVIDGYSPTLYNHTSINNGSNWTQHNKDHFFYAIMGDFVTGLKEEKEFPTSYILEQNYPNPFNPSTKINYSIPQTSIVTLKIYDVLGNEIKTLINEEQNLGNYEIDFNASNLSSGIYIYQLRADDLIFSKKMLLLK